MHHSRLLLVAGLALLGACGSDGGGSSSGLGGNQGAPVTSTVSGVVLDKNGASVAGVTVNVFHHNTNTTATITTDANGHCAMAGLDTGVHADYAIYVQKAALGFSASAGDPAAAVTKFDFNGLYRTVVRFATLPAQRSLQLDPSAPTAHPFSNISFANAY